MSFTHRFYMECLCIAALSGAVAACAANGDDDDGNGNQTGTGGAFAPGTGGMTAGGTGGMTAGGTGGMTAGGTGGMTAGGTGGMTAGGTGGMTAGGTGGMTAGGTGGVTAGGTGGMTAGGTGGMMASDGGSDQCATDVVADDPTTTTECAACLCMNCNAEVTAMKGDDKAKALLNCGKTNNCSGSCCFCGDPCDSLGANYRMGPCAEETEMAAGLPTPSTALDNGADLMTACGMAGNSCNKPSVLADCTAMHCMTQCPAVAACAE